jgi:light-regulated signal transduction histidine kinase (bacteriophytochrome)
MGNLIDDLLKLSQINRKPFKRTKVSISLLAKNIAERLAESNKKRQIEFIIQPDLIVYGDARLIEILLNNLFENAVKFTAKKPMATIQFGITIINNNAAYFVKDNGVGFEMQTADKLFGAFQRLHSHSDFEGTGIGLATVQRIINLHNGQVWAIAAVDEGATFYFIF